MKKHSIYILISIILIFVLILGIGIWYYGNKEEQNYELGKGIIIESVTGYTGKFMEDGSDKKVEDVWQITVTNTSDQDIQYLKINASKNENDAAEFEITTLTAGSTVKVLESHAKEFSDDAKNSTYEIKNLAYFAEELSLYTELFQVSVADNWIRVENISEEDYTNDIYVYYKNVEDGIFTGGITYRTKFSGGLKAGEVKEVETQHFDPEKSQIMYLTYK